MKVELLHTRNQLNFGNFKNFEMGKKFTFSFFHFFIFFLFLFRAYGREYEKEGGGIRQRGCPVAPQPKRVKRENACHPAGHPSPSGPPLHPHGTRQNHKNESTKKLKK